MGNCNEWMAVKVQEPVELGDMPVAMWVDGGIHARVYWEWQPRCCEGSVNGGALDNWGSNVGVEGVGSTVVGGLWFAV